MNIKLIGNVNNFPNNNVKKGYLLSLLSGEALSSALPTFQAINSTFQQLIDVLEVRFGDVNTRKTARSAYHRYYQNNRPFREFITEFLKHVQAAGIPTTKQAKDLCEKITRKLYEATISFKPIDLGSYIQHLTRVTHNIEDGR